MEEVFPKPILVVSACLSGERKRYDGKIIKKPFVEKLKNYCKFILFCPETGIGLPVPRDRTILVKKGSTFKAVYLGTGEDITPKVLSYYEKFKAKLNWVDGFLLKSKSPSCGIAPKTKTYKDEKGEVLCGRYPGIVSKVLAKDFSCPIADEVLLKSQDFFEEFMFKLFLSARLRLCFNGILDEEWIYPLLFTFCPEKLNSKTPISDFKSTILKCIESPLNRGRFVNACYHLLSKAKREVSKGKKTLFEKEAEKFMRKKRSLLEFCKVLRRVFPLNIVKKYSYIFYPFPEELGFSSCLQGL